LSFQWGGESGHGGLPGGITVQDFATNPKKTYKPLDNGSNDSSHLGVNGEFGLGDWRAAFDLSHKNVNIDSNYVVDDFYSQNKTSSTRGGVRTWRNFSAEGLTYKFLVGADAERWSQDRNTNYGNTTVDQSSDALFGRYELLSQRQGLSGYVGVRRTQSKRQAQGDYSGQLDVNNQSWDIGLAKTVADGAEVFARVGTSFRLANADEFSCYTYFCPGNTLNLLKPQQSRDQEVGYKQRQVWGQWSARAYRYAFTNEIGMGSDQFSNVNYDPTRRQGLELDTKAHISPKFDAAVQYAYREAVFTEGSYAGKQVPLAPKNVLTARLSYLMSETQNISLMTQWVSSQKISGDFGNTCQDDIASYALVNARYSQKINSWTLSAGVNNLFDKHYYNLRTRCDPTKKSIYPEVGRTFLVTLQNRF
jgi:iron complex outermembrane receptor protein